jgi:hypothetical protein
MLIKKNDRSFFYLMGAMPGEKEQDHDRDSECRRDEACGLWGGEGQTTRDLGERELREGGEQGDVAGGGVV